MTPQGALPSDIQPLDRSVPYIDERGGRSPRRGRAFPDPSREEPEKGKQPEPAAPVAELGDDPAEPAPEPSRPRVDIRVLQRFLPTGQILAGSAPSARAH